VNWIEVPIDVRAVVESLVPEQVKLNPTNIVRPVDDAFGFLGQMLAQECRAVGEFVLAITPKNWELEQIFAGSTKAEKASRSVSETVSTRSARRRYRSSAAFIFRHSSNEMALQIGFVANS
jgi:hypothetical protein